MKSTLKLVGPAWSRAFRCIWMLEELGVPYEYLDVIPVSRRAKEYNASGKLPVLLEYDHDGDNRDAEHQSPSFVLTESVAINSYLADTYGSHLHLIPTAGTRQRALYDQTVCCILSELDAQGLWIHRKHEAMAHFFGACPDAVAHAKQQYFRMNRHVAQQLNPYLLGDSFTAADILYVHCLDWASSIGWKEDDSDEESLVGLKTYRELCHQRPAYQRAKALRDADKEERKAKEEELQASNKEQDSSSKL